MAKTRMMNEIEIKPPPGIRFVNWHGSDVVVQVPRGRELEAAACLKLAAQELEDSVNETLESVADFAASAQAHQAAIQQLEVAMGHTRPRLPIPQMPPRRPFPLASGGAAVPSLPPAGINLTPLPAVNTAAVTDPCSAEIKGVLGHTHQCELQNGHATAHIYHDHNKVKCHFVLPGETPPPPETG